MCGIVALLDLNEGSESARALALRLVKALRHRGPDWSGMWADGQAVLAHERLAIVDPATGDQPLVDAESGVVLAANAEIYNHLTLRAQLSESFRFQTRSDCEAIIAAYLRYGAKLVEHLDGMFGFVLYSPRERRYLIARDRIGIIPLYYGYDAAGRMLVASELKALAPACVSIKEFPPGHVYDSLQREFVRYYAPAWEVFDRCQFARADRLVLRRALEDSVRSHMMSDVPYGVLLSGGLDSSLVAAIAARTLVRRDAPGLRRLHSFSIGLEGSPDLRAARLAADALGSEHHAFHFTVEQGIDALSDVIYALETYDLTTVRASTPMYLMARRIKAMGFKMVLSGEGADELFGGYLYFHNAPDERAFHDESVRKVKRLHLFDCLRANKSMAAWGVEVRVPFLDHHFVDVAMSLDPAAKMCGRGRIEKRILREAFSDALPSAILWRQKEQFSDGVGYGWIDSLKAYAERVVPDAAFAAAAERFPVNTPDTKEGYLYRSLFDAHFPHADAALCVPSGRSLACSTPEALAWQGNQGTLADPSGRAARGVHADAY